MPSVCHLCAWLKPYRRLKKGKNRMMWFAMNLASLAGSYLAKKDLDASDLLKSLALASLCMLLKLYLFPEKKKSPHPQKSEPAKFWQAPHGALHRTNLTDAQLLQMHNYYRCSTKADQRAQDTGIKTYKISPSHKPKSVS